MCSDNGFNKNQERNKKLGWRVRVNTGMEVMLIANPSVHIDGDGSICERNTERNTEKQNNRAALTVRSPHNRVTAH